MNPSHYQKATQVTLSPQYHTNMVDAGQLLDTLGELRDVIAKLDGIKKALFYGRPMSSSVADQLGVPDTDTHGHIQVHLLDTDPDVGVTILHCILGLTTEAGEQCELLEDVLRGHKKFDPVNYLEESGDATWYLSNGLAVLGFCFEQCFQVNIDKLQGTPDKPGRFRGQFDSFYAINRDLVRERATLEAGAGTAGWQATVHPALLAEYEKRAASAGKPLCKLDNWVLIMHGNRTALAGDVKGHPRLGDAKDCTTSSVIDECPMEATENSLVETKNTMYVLGKQKIG